MNLLIALFTFRGTLSRGGYWVWTLMVWLVFCSVRTAVSVWVNGDVAAWTNRVLAIAMIWVLIALSIRRMHDRSRSGRWLLVALIPVIGPLWVLGQLALGGSGHYASSAIRSTLSMRRRTLR